MLFPRLNDLIFRAVCRFFPLNPELSGARLSPLGMDNSAGLMESIVWGVPKRRRTIERRMTRRFGSKQWGTSKLVPMNRKIRVDDVTGEYFQLGELAPRKYRKIMEETELINKKMKEIFFKAPKDSEVIPRYTGEDSFGNSKGRILEMNKPRPEFFDKNLKQKVISKPGSSTLRPTGLG